MISNVRDAKRILVTIAAILIVICAVCVALMMSPLAGSASANHQAYEQVRAQLQEKRREDIPARDIGPKLAEAKKQIDDFYRDRLPSRYSAISDELGKLASAHHVQVSSVQYKADDSEINGLQRVTIEVGVAGDYANEMKFVNGLERDKILFVIDGVDLGEAQGGNVRLRMRLETYLKPGAAA